MPLAAFLDDLLATGQVTVAGQLQPFTAAELAEATAHLRAYHATDTQRVPYTAPAFEPAAALWALALLYRTMQLAFLRDYDEAAVNEHLADWPGPITPETHYSVDLSFRYLPPLLGLAKHLAPADVLVARLHALGQQWPLSFVGTAPAPTEAPAAVLTHPALRALYLDRVIEHRDRVRAAQPGVAEEVAAALGEFQAALWPGFVTLPILSLI